MQEPTNRQEKLVNVFKPSAQQSDDGYPKSLDETEQRLWQCKAELAKAQENLKSEISRLMRAEQAFCDSERRLQAILDTNRSILIEREDAEELLREVSAQLARSTNADRQLARELHDTTSPALAGVLARLYLVKKLGKLDGMGSAALVDSLALMEHIANEIRSLSERLESPILDRSGLVPAIRSFVQQFEKHSGVQIALELDAQLAGLPVGVERTLFRIVEEVLPEIHRNLGTRRAEIQLCSTATAYTLEVRCQLQNSDRRVAILETTGPRLGTKLAGPRERILELGGELFISTDSGIVVRATVPVLAG